MIIRLTLIHRLMFTPLFNSIRASSSCPRRIARWSGMSFCSKKIQRKWSKDNAFLNYIQRIAITSFCNMIAAFICILLFINGPYIATPYSIIVIISNNNNNNNVDNCNGNSNRNSNSNSNNNNASSSLARNCPLFFAPHRTCTVRYICAGLQQ